MNCKLPTANYQNFSIIPTGTHKRPTCAWKIYQQRRAEGAELARLFAHPHAVGLAVVCGAVSGGLEVIDIDCKYDLTGTLFESYMQWVAEHSLELAQRLLVAQTVNGGYHIYYRCAAIEGNKKLACRATTADERGDNASDKVRVLIETRGEGGYVVAWPSTGYTFMNGMLPADCPTISPEERAALLAIARSFNSVDEQQPTKRPITNTRSTAPGDDYDAHGDVVALLQQHGWTVVRETAERVIFKRPGNTTSRTSGDYNKSMNRFMVFTTSSVFEPMAAYKPWHVYAMLEHGGDYSRAAKELLKQGYGGRTRRTFNQATTIRRELDAVDAGAVVEATEEIKTFWDVSDQGKVTIARERLMHFLHTQGGFALYFYDGSNAFTLVRNTNGLVEEATTEQLKKFVKYYIASLPDVFDGITRSRLMEVILRGAGQYFSDAALEFFDAARIDFLRDAPGIAYFPFRNGVVCVTAAGYELKTYAMLKKCVWKSQVIDRSITLQEVADLNDVEYYRFISKIAGDEPARIKYCCAITGYLLHGYKDPTTPYSVILGEETDDEKKGGGTGKGIFITALSHLLSTVTVDGKNFRHDKSFLWQRVRLDTRMVAIQDVRRNVDFEGFYSIITEGMTVERKNRDELFIPFADAPKIIFTTNYTITSSGAHAARRQRLIEFSPFFSVANTPLQHFGHRLFDDWDEHQWQLFYNFMFCCCRLYLQGGVPHIAHSHTIRNKQTRLTYGEEFLSWWEEYMTGEQSKEYNMITPLYESFLQSSEIDSKEFSIRKFKKALEDSAALNGFELDTYKSRSSGGKRSVALIRSGAKNGVEVQTGATSGEAETQQQQLFDG